MSEDSNKPKVINKTIRLAGDKDNCGYCDEGNKFFEEYAPKTNTTYEYHHIDSDKGKEIASNLDEGPNGGVPIPAIEYCKTIDNDGKQEEICDYVEGFKKNDWDTSSLNYKKPNEVDEELEELFGDAEN